MGFSHLHFIHTIKGGLVVNVFNANSSRRPAFKFKRIKTIYESEDASITGSQSLVHLEEGSIMGSHFGRGAANIEMPCLHRALRTVKSELETHELHENGGDSQRKSDRGDCSICDMTLKELQKCCKRRKKKKLVGSFENTDNLLSLGDTSNKQGCPDLHVKEESDIEEPLITWKLKRSKKTKVKKNSIGKHAHLSSKTAGLAEQIPSASQDLPQYVRNMQVPINIKIEISEPEFTCVSDGSTSDHCDEIDFHRDFPDEVHKVDNRGDKGYMESDSTCISNGSTLECHDDMDFCRDSFSEEPKIVNHCDMGSLEPTLTEESQNCVINEASFECLELGESTSAPFSDKMMLGENVEKGFQQMTGHDSFFSSVLEHTRKGNNTHHLSCYSIAETIPVPDNLNSDISDSIDSSGSINGHSFPDQISSQMNWNLTQLPTALNGGLHCIELDCSKDRCLSDLKSEVISSGDYPHLNGINTYNSGSTCISFQESMPSFSANSNADPVCDGSPTAQEKHSFRTTDGSVNSGVDGSVNCSMETLVLDASKGLTATEVFENNHQLDLQYPPKRLLLKRKAISPTSQERLWKAMGTDEQHDRMENFKSGLDGFEIAVSPKQVIKKPKNCRNGSPRSVPKGILKASRSFLAPHEGTDCTFIHTHAQKAIAFSQRQMHDIDCLAMKLLKELKLMKEIVEENWLSNGYSSILSKYTSDELRMTIENAGEVEETTKKWLSMMARDCNRFCKIMRSNEKTAATSVYDVHKGRKKITFADEAGGMLCHVKIFEDHPAPPLTLESEMADLDPAS